MPLPTPNAGESQDKFIARCMANPTANKDFPDSKQRAGVCFTQWRRKDKAMEGFDERLGRYTVEVDGEGTKSIKGVPIFKLGTFKSKTGSNYDENWAKRAIAKHNALKSEGGYIPPLFVGHTKEGEEKAACGHFDNLRLDGDKVVADLTHVPDPTFNELKAGKWPSRSVEALNTEGDARILGLALLGSSTPACKFNPIHFDDVDPESVESHPYQVNDMADDDVVVVMAAEKQVDTEISNVKEAEMADEDKKVEDETKDEEVVEETDDASEDKVTDDAAEKLNEKIKQNESDKMAERIVALEAKLSEYAAKADKAEELSRAAKVDTFIDKMNAKGKLSKGQIDYDGEKDSLALRKLMMSFSDEQRDEFEKFVAATPTKAHFEATAVQGDEDAKNASSDKQSAGEELDKLAQDYMKENDVDIKTAQVAVAKAHPELVKF